jgi:hypothetical protein
MANIGEKDEVYLAAVLLCEDPSCKIEFRGASYSRNENNIYLNFNKITTVDALKSSLLNDNISTLLQAPKPSGNKYKTDLIYKGKNMTAKSWNGADPTLFNASNHTNFTYKVLSNLTNVEVIYLNTIESSHKIYDKINAIYKNNGILVFDKIKSVSLNDGLLKINPELPQLLSKGLLDWRLEHNPNIRDLFKWNSPIVDLLYASLLGFTPTKGVCNENISCFAAIPKKKEPVFFDLLNTEVVLKIKNDLYLFTFFDSPSTDRHNYGYFYIEGENCYIDLCLQIRLKTVLDRKLSLTLSEFVNS